MEEDHASGPDGTRRPGRQRSLRRSQAVAGLLRVWSCSTGFGGARCNGRHADLVNENKDHSNQRSTTNQEVGSSNLSGRANYLRSIPKRWVTFHTGDMWSPAAVEDVCLRQRSCYTLWPRNPPRLLILFILGSSQPVRCGAQRGAPPWVATRIGRASRSLERRVAVRSHSGRATIHRPRKWRLPLLESPRHEHDAGTFGSKSDIRDVWCRHGNGAYQLFVLIHHEDSA